MVQELITLVNSDPALSRRGLAYNLELGLVIEDHRFLFEINNGKLTGLHKDADRQAANGFTLTLPRSSWSRYCQPLPPPEYHDIFAMLSCGHLTLTGDTDLLMSNLLYVTGFLGHCKNILDLEDRP